MAQIRLTIGDIAVTNESLTSTVKFDTNSYQVCLVSLSFQKKMYQPTEIKAELQFFMTSKWVSIGRTDIEETFKLKNAILEVVEPKTSNSSDDDKYTVLDTIGKDFYVHDVRPHYQPECMYVSLKIYSLDKLLTLNKECNTYVGKKLSSILGSVLGNYKVPYATSSTLSYDNSGMQVLQVDASGSDSDDNKDKKEHKFPYLIQYNESFYDLLKRTTNRWGEFLYWENGTLTIGYDDSKPIKVDTTKFTDIYYFDLDSVALDLPGAGSYDYAAAYDENVGNKPIKKDPYQVYGKLFKFNGQLDKYAFSVASRFFQNEESVTAWAVGLLVDDLYDMIAESKYVKSDNKDFKDNYFDSNYDTEQYNDNEDELNLYSEYGSKYDKDTSYYSEILGYETAAGKNAIRIKYDTTWPEMKLGDVITVKDDKFIVVEVLGVSPKELRILDNSKVLVYPSQTITFEIVATAINKTDNKYYPATLPTGHVRRSGPQVATIVDMDDPLKANRVRVVYDWQGENASESDYSPWLLYAAGSHGSPRAGRHLNGTKVLVGFANDNIERPYVLGNIQEADTFVELKDVSLETPGKRKFQMWDHVGGVQKFVSGTFAPIVSTISDFSPTVDYLSLGDGGLQYAGGFCITDRLGLYNISGSTEEREVKISSAWGDVKVSAFTGISISAPNGDVKINGKNVEISAGNNLTLTSGKNVGYHVAWGKGEDPSFSTVLSDLVCKLIDKVGEKVQLIDLSFIRDTLEVVFRPHEGSLTLKSNRYMKLETGSNECDYPVAAYNKDKRQKIVDEEAKSSILSTIGGDSFKAVDPFSGNDTEVPSSISMIRSLIWIINKLSGIFTAWLDDYQKEYDKLVDLRLQFDKAIKPLQVLSNSEDWTTAKVCQTYDELKESFWNMDNTDDWTEDNLNFTEDVAIDEGDDLLTSVNEHSRERCRHFVSSALPDREKKIAETVIMLRKENRKIVVDAANELRKAILKLKLPEWSEIDLSKEFSTKMGYYMPFPDQFISNLEDALSKDNCKEVPEFHAEESRKALANKIGNTADFVAWKKYMSRMVVVKFLESLGFTDDMRRKITDPEDKKKTIEVKKPNFSLKGLNQDQSLANTAYWKKYVESLSGVPAIKKAESSLLTAVANSAADALKGAIDYDNIMGIKENFSWSEGKKGGVLFGYKGDTYELKGKEIEKIETIEPKIKSISENSEGIDTWDKERLVEFMAKLREALGKI